MLKIDKKTTVILIIFLGLFTNFSCSKYLDEKPDKSIALLRNSEDLQALLDNDQINSNSVTGLITLGSGEFYVTNAYYSTMNVNERASYTWDGNADYDGWTLPYKVINTANTVLQEIERLKIQDNNTKNYLKGQALFIRAFCFFHLAQIYCNPYSSNSNKELGIVLRLLPDIEVKSERTTVSKTYDQIIFDLKESSKYLPPISTKINRASQAAAYGLLARVYLTMRRYDEANEAAENSLKINSQLLDYNLQDTTSIPAFQLSNKEIIFYSFIGTAYTARRSLLDSNLLSSYQQNDLRKPLFFRIQNGETTFKGGYDGQTGTKGFCGVATDELYLIKAECHARNGNVQQGNKYLNDLLIKRFKKGTFSPLNISSPTALLDSILVERRKELVFRGTLWSDLRRLNLEGKNIELQRFINGAMYKLPPLDKRWTWLIPSKVILATQMPQNDR